MRIGLLALLSGVLSASGVVVVSPRDGATVKLLPEAQRGILALPTMAERIAYLGRYGRTGDSASRKEDWNQAKPLVLRWRPEPGDRGSSSADRASTTAAPRGCVRAVAR